MPAPPDGHCTTRKVPLMAPMLYLGMEACKDSIAGAEDLFQVMATKALVLGLKDMGASRLNENPYPISMKMAARTLPHVVSEKLSHLDNQPPTSAASHRLGSWHSH